VQPKAGPVLPQTLLNTLFIWFSKVWAWAGWTKDIAATAAAAPMPTMPVSAAVATATARSGVLLVPEIELSSEVFDMSDCLPKQSLSSAAQRLQ